ncbi:hypothetical protein [Bacillus toyonensis]|uniref:hypothetical protein n=1 Tax=Bacillus toyonensis TaxID=155322 RepID=UPI000BF21C38|nr:hypothetical protein [Bacillus toyonensis]PEO25780.1 hypothetical protein CN589_23130 [Bacillus toyonensis]PFY03787.1 hypothetical protein COL45_08870 [Bacillus toyonensis]PHB85864.1 hypothetical protein COE93_01375 [Bacillus toyonensis]
MGNELEGFRNSFNEGRTAPNPPGTGKKPPKGGCCCGEFDSTTESRGVLPRIFQKFIRTISPDEVHRVSKKSLHPVVRNLVENILSLEDTYNNYITTTGNILNVSFSSIQQQGNDLSTKVQIEIDEKKVFSGQLTIFGAFVMGKVTFSSTITCFFELIYLQLLEIAVRDLNELRLYIGIMEVTGTVSHQKVIKNVIKSTCSTMVANMRNKNEFTPVFDAASMYGTFPSTDFCYFYGIGSELIDTQPKRENDI